MAGKDRQDERQDQRQYEHHGDQPVEDRIERLGGLTITRRVGESLVIGAPGEEVVVGVVYASGDGETGRAKLVISAPLEIPVFRSELWLERSRDAEAEESKSV